LLSEVGMIKGSSHVLWSELGMETGPRSGPKIEI
jgi:hypothetical protein